MKTLTHEIPNTEYARELSERMHEMILVALGYTRRIQNHDYEMRDVDTDAIIVEQKLLQMVELAEELTETNSNFELIPVKEEAKESKKKSMWGRISAFASMFFLLTLIFGNTAEAQMVAQGVALAKARVVTVVNTNTMFAPTTGEETNNSNKSLAYAAEKESDATFGNTKRDSKVNAEITTDRLSHFNHRVVTNDGFLVTTVLQSNDAKSKVVKIVNISY